MSVIVDPESPASAVRTIREEMSRVGCSSSPQMDHNLAYLEKLTDKPMGIKRPMYGGARKTRKGGRRMMRRKTYKRK